jgi:hypothetical protein
LYVYAETNQNLNKLTSIPLPPCLQFTMEMEKKDQLHNTKAQHMNACNANIKIINVLDSLGNVMQA